MSSESNYPRTPVDLENLKGTPVSVDAGDSDSGTQRVVIASNQSPLPIISTPNFATRQDIFTAVGDGETVDRTTAPLKKFGLQVKSTGSPATNWEVVLEGSLDGVNFSEVLNHTQGVGDGQVMWSGPLDSPCLHFRSRVLSLTLGTATNIAVTILGME